MVNPDPDEINWLAERDIIERDNWEIHVRQTYIFSDSLYFRRLVQTMKKLITLVFISLNVSLQYMTKSQLVRFKPRSVYLQEF